MVEIQPYLQKIVDRIADPRNQGGLKDFSRVLLFEFTDTNEKWVIRTLGGGQVTLQQGSTEQVDVTIITTTDILAGVVDKKINGMTAYMQKRIRVKGKMEDLLNLQKFLL